MIDTSKPLHINSMNFRKIIENGTVVVDFWAPWCSPCRAMEPILDEVAGKTGGSALVAKLNVDDNPSIANQYGIFSIPTLIIFHQGKESRRFTGVQPADRILKIIADLKSKS